MSGKEQRPMSAEAALGSQRRRPPMQLSVANLGGEANSGPASVDQHEKR